MGRLITVEYNQIKHQLEIDAQLAEFEKNRNRPIMETLSLSGMSKIQMNIL